MASETPDARDRAVAEAIVRAQGNVGETRDAVAAALATARAEERAACIEAVQEIREHGMAIEWDVLDEVAAALRARGEG